MYKKMKKVKKNDKGYRNKITYIIYSIHIYRINIMKWVDALKEWNTKQKNEHKRLWCIPRKGTPEYYEVQKIMGGKQDESATKLQAALKRKLTPKPKPKPEPKPEKKTNLLDLPNDVLNKIGDVVLKDNAERLEQDQRKLNRIKRLVRETFYDEIGINPIEYYLKNYEKYIYEYADIITQDDKEKHIKAILLGTKNVNNKVMGIYTYLTELTSYFYGGEKSCHKYPASKDSLHDLVYNRYKLIKEKTNKFIEDYPKYNIPIVIDYLKKIKDEAYIEEDDFNKKLLENIKRDYEK
jgi:hypothetical protein